MQKLMLHCDAGKASRDDVKAVLMPPNTKTHYPIPHYQLLRETEDCLGEYGYRVTEEQHGLTTDGARYFGLLNLHNDHSDFGLVVGVRNSHDKKFSAGLVAGSRVFVCDNLAFSGTINIARKHTRHILNDLPHLMGRLVGKLGAYFNHQTDQIQAYKDAELSEARARWLMIEGVKRGVYGCTQLPKILEEWEKPRHEEFEPRNVWSLFNSITEIAKSWPVAQVMRRTPLLHGMCDMEVGFATSA